MIKWIGIILTLTLLSACDQGDSGGGKPDGNKPKPPSQSELPQWGELKCQLDQTCADPILRMDYKFLVDALADGFWRPRSEAENKRMSKEEKFFSCGTRTYEFWKKLFPNATEDEEDLYMTFSLRVLDPQECALKFEFKKIVNQYFIESEDYKNETESNL